MIEKKERFLAILKSLKKSLGVSNDGEVAIALGIKPAAFANRKVSGSIPYEEIHAFCDKENIHLYDIFGSDNPLLADAAKRSKKNNSKSAPETLLRSIDGNAEGIHVFDAEAACGAGFINDTACVIDTLFIDASLLRQHDVKAEDARIFRSRGDSMVPTVPVRADVLIDISKKSATGGGVFAFRIDDECFIKRLMLDKTANQLHVISDNTTYPKQLFSLNEGLDIEIIGKLKAYIKWF